MGVRATVRRATHGAPRDSSCSTGNTATGTRVSTVRVRARIDPSKPRPVLLRLQPHAEKKMTQHKRRDDLQRPADAEQTCHKKAKPQGASHPELGDGATRRVDIRQIRNLTWPDPGGRHQLELAQENTGVGDHAQPAPPGSWPVGGSRLRCYLRVAGKVLSVAVVCQMKSPGNLLRIVPREYLCSPHPAG